MKVRDLLRRMKTDNDVVTVEIFRDGSMVDWLDMRDIRYGYYGNFRNEIIVSFGVSDNTLCIFII